jgi:hypothetical protein
MWGRRLVGPPHQLGPYNWTLPRNAFGNKYFIILLAGNSKSFSWFDADMSEWLTEEIFKVVSP